MKIDFQKLQALTEDETFDYILSTAKSFGFPATSFQSGSIGYSLLKTTSHIVSVISQSVENLAQSMYLSTAVASGLDILGENHYGIARFQATQSIIKPCIINNGALAISKAINEVLIKVFYGTDSSGNDIYVTYKNSSAFTINAGSSVYVEFVSDNFGATSRTSQQNKPIYITEIPLTDFLSISQEEGYFYQVQNGQDKEVDKDYRERCKGKWASITANGPEDAYYYWIKSSINASGNPVNITRIYFDKSIAQFSGVIVIYCASDEGTASAEDLLAADANVQKYRPINAQVYVDPAVEKLLNYTLVITANSPKTDTELKQDICDAIIAYLATVNIGGTKMYDTQGYILSSEIIDAIMNIKGIVDAKITAKYVNGNTYPSNLTDISVLFSDVCKLDEAAQKLTTGIYRV